MSADPGVREAIVLLAKVEVKPVLLSATQAYQPFLALVLTVKVTPVVAVAAEEESAPVKLSVLVERAKLNVGLTVALTVI